MTETSHGARTPRSVNPTRALLALLAGGLLPLGCLVGGGAASAPQQRDERLLTELRRQEKWAGEGAAGKASAEELRRAQEGDRDAQADLRKRYRQLLRAAERATWVREVTPAAIEPLDAREKAELVASFDRAARLRKEAWDAADQIAEALAAVHGPSPLSLADLRRGLASVRAAQASEARIVRAQAGSPARAPRSGADAGPEAADGGARAAGAPAQSETAGATLRLAPARPPVPKPFIEAAALLIFNHPDEEEGLLSFKPDLAEEATQIHAALDDLRSSAPPQGAPASVAPGLSPNQADKALPENGSGPETTAGAAAQVERDGGDGGVPGQPAQGPDASRSGTAAAAPERSLQLRGDALQVLKTRGAPESIAVRPDGTFVLRYDAGVRCVTPPCPAAEELVFDANGNLIAPGGTGAKSPPQNR